MNESEVADVLGQIVAKAGRIRGADLARELRVRVPNWTPGDFNVANLRDFIARHVKSIHVSGRSGMDLWYEPLIEHSLSVKSEATDLWRIWASPNSPYVLGLKAEDGSVVPLQRSATPTNGVQVLEPASIELHKKIARDFLRDFQLEAQSLKNAIDSSSPHWWQRWYSEVKKAHLATSWNEYRRRHLETELQIALSAAGLENVSAEKALHAIAVNPTTSDSEKLPERSLDLRSAVIRVIERMSEDELRELRLPVGLMMDVLRARNA